MIFIATIATLVLLLVILWITGVLLMRRQSREGDITSDLRELLLARAEGRINNEEFDRRQAALHASLLASPQRTDLKKLRVLRWAVPVLIAIVIVPPAVVYVYYDKLREKGAGSFPASTTTSGVTMPKPQVQGTNTGGDLNTAVKHLAEKMAKNPGNGDGWLLLARTYGELHQPREAANAYAKAATLIPPDAAFLTEWADARVLANERKWDDESRDIVMRALKTDPVHLKALALAGSEAYYRADYKAALSYWKRLQAAAPAGSRDAKLAEMNIQEVNAIMAGKKPG